MARSELDTDALIALADSNARHLLSMSAELREVVDELRRRQPRIEAKAREQHDDG